MCACPSRQHILDNGAVAHGDALRARTTEINEIVHRVENDGFPVEFTVLDCPGFGDAMDSTAWIDRIVAHITDRFAQHYEALGQPPRAEAGNYLQRDGLVHVCLYFIAAHRLKGVDLEFMRRLEPYVNLVPVIAKADTMTLAERDAFRRLVLSELKACTRTCPSACTCRCDMCMHICTRTCTHTCKLHATCACICAHAHVHTHLLAGFGDKLEACDIQPRAHTHRRTVCSRSHGHARVQACGVKIFQMEEAPLPPATRQQASKEMGGATPTTPDHRDLGIPPLDTAPIPGPVATTKPPPFAVSCSSRHSCSCTSDALWLTALSPLTSTGLRLGGRYTRLPVGHMLR